MQSEHRLMMAAVVTLLGACAGPAVLPLPALPAPVAGSVLKSELLARGVQIYECRVGSALQPLPQWALLAPEAELFDLAGRSAGRHGAGPHWESNDTSRIVGTVVARVDAPRAGDIPWLLLSTKSVGPDGHFSGITSIQRIHTVGGSAPAANTCHERVVGLRTRVDYTAIYRRLYGRN